MSFPRVIEPQPSADHRDWPLATVGKCSDLALDQSAPSRPVQRFFFVILPALVGFFGLLGLVLVQVLISKDFLEE